jgi:hypothetical protein
MAVGGFKEIAAGQALPGWRVVGASGGITFKAKAGTQWTVEYHLTFWVGNVYSGWAMFTAHPASLNQERKEFALTIKATSSRTTIFHLSTAPRHR